MSDHLLSAPKRGGILQNSGFLDLKSLMALGQTCKVNMIDELSLIVLIENELTLYHGVQTKEDAISFWKRVHDNILLKQWLDRDGCTAAVSIKVSPCMLSEAVCYERMLAKMLRTIPPADREIVSTRDECGMTLLHYAAASENLGSTKAIIDIHLESQRLDVVNLQDDEQRTVLHCAVLSDNSELISFLLNLWPESDRLEAVTIHNADEQTVLHYAVDNSIIALRTIMDLLPESDRMQAVLSNDLLHCAACSIDPEPMKYLLSLLPESQLFSALNMHNRSGDTVLHCAARDGRIESVRIILFILHPKSHYLPVISEQSTYGNTALHCAAYSGNIELLKFLLDSLPEENILEVLNTTNRDGSTVLHCVAMSGNVKFVKAVLSHYPEAERLQALSVEDGNERSAMELAGLTHDYVLEHLL